LNHGARAPSSSRQGRPVGTGRLTFAGRHAPSADLAALRRAERLGDGGADPRRVWRETGWFRGLDGLWRWEIDDAATRLLPPLPCWDRAPRILAHPDLDRAYDCARLAVLRVRLRPGADAAGRYRPGRAATATHCARDAEISLLCGTAGDARAAALHELQHVVQDREGFAPGAGRAAVPSWDAYVNSPGEAEARAVEARRDLTAAQRRALFPLDSYDLPLAAAAPAPRGVVRGAAAAAG
jgi:Large polyvalent protein associated domain 23